MADDTLHFGKQIRPILAEHCLACHGFDSAARQADLRLDLRESAIEAGAIDPEKPEESLLLERIFSDDPELVMPPPSTKKQLTAEQKDLLKKWIEQSAKYEEHWAFQAPQKPSLPQPEDANWAKNGIDHFVLKLLEENKLKPAPPAEPANLFRRLHLDITGLPPSLEDLNQFLDDYQAGSEQALSSWIDNLMARPAWGEHRGRYWLDLARYSDTHGMHFDNYREMWPYRDWVVRAFNANQPYDQFMLEQVAGDLLDSPTTDQLIATGFQRCNITTNEGGTIEDENLALYAADRVQTFGWAFLGLTLNCAQCHDHKFDAVTTKEYYAMAAFFRNTTQRGLDGNSKDGNASILHLPVEADLARWKALPDEIAATRTEMEKYREAAYAKFSENLKIIDAQSVKQKIRQANLELHVPFIDGSGEQVQTSRGTSIASVGQPTWNPDGKFGPAATITQPTSFLIGDAGNWEFDQSFSYGAWIKPADRNVTGAILARMDTANRFRGWDLLQQGPRVSVHLIDSWSDNAIKVRTEPEVLAGDRWQHVFVTYDGTRRPEGIKIFVDGISQPIAVDNSSLKAEASLKTTTPARAGQRRSDSYWNGSIQELRMYQCTLTEQEVADLVYGDEIGLLLSLEESKRTPDRIKQSFDLVIPSVDVVFKTQLQKLTNLEREYNEIRQRSPITHIQQEKTDTQPQTPILMRGEYDKLGEIVNAGTPGLLHPFAEGLPRDRLGLAKWLSDPGNPVTARVTVNRFWQEMFGQGLVATAEDFGVMGTPPTHPELLDWLATDFQQNGWDVKRFYKQVLMSATYRQSAQITKEKLERDPSNALLSRGPRFRMDGEMIRDFALSTSGLLSTKMFGPGAKPYQPENIWNIVGLPEGNTRNYQQDTGENLYRRSLYSFWKRMAHPPNLEILNAPSREVCVVKRERTNTPLQALVTLNDPLFVEAARNLAQRSIKQKVNSDSKPTPSENDISIAPLIEAYRPESLRKWESEIRALESLDSSEASRKDSILFVGSSSIVLWKSIAEDLKPWPVVRRGFGGAKFSDVAVFAERLIHPHDYRALVIFVANDIAGGEDQVDKSPEEVAKWFEYVANVALKHRPNSPVFLIAITPTKQRFHVWPKIQTANNLLRKVCETYPQLHFVETEHFFLDDNGKPRTELFVEDGLHLSNEGYQVWAKILEKHLGQQFATASTSESSSSETPTETEDNLKQATVQEVLDRIASNALGRQLSDIEINLLTKDYQDYLAYYQVHREDALALLKTGESPVDSEIDASELAAWTMVCQQFLNLDEAITK